MTSSGWAPASDLASLARRAAFAFDNPVPERALPPVDAAGLSRSTYLAAWRVDTAGRVLRLGFEAKGRGNVGGGPRGRICAFSEGSRRRMLQTLGAVEWEVLGPLLFLTLTYHEPPSDGPSVKAHLAAFRKRWERRFGPARGAWKLEFQKRGAAHFHLELACPEGYTVDQVRDWAAIAWHEIVTHGRRVDRETGEVTFGGPCPGREGCSDWAHRRAGTQLDRSAGRDPARYFAKYGVADAKQYQNERPAWFDQVGRWWGLWSVRPAWRSYTVDAREAILTRRVMVRMMRARVRSFRSPAGRTRGLWVLGRPGSSVAADVSRAVECWMRARNLDALGESPGRALGHWRLWTYGRS